MHGWVFDWWQYKCLIFLSVDNLNFARLYLSFLLISKKFLLVEWDSFLSTCFFEQLDHILFCWIFIWLWWVIVVNEYLSPKRILGDIEFLLWLEQCLSWESFLTFLLSSSYNSTSFVWYSLDDTLKSINKVLPILVWDSTTNLISSWVIW